MSLFPPEAEATAFTTLDQLRQWYGLAAEPWQAFHLQVGQPDVRIFSALPAEALVENIMLTRVGVAAASLSPAHAVQIGLVWRLANRIIHTRGGGNYDSWRDVDPWAKPAAATPATLVAAPPALKERGIKMSSIIDQSDDSEFVPESLAKADGWYQRYLKIMGGPSQEEEDCTVEQLSALNKRVHTLDLPPYVDLWVWQPFPDGAGGYIAKELPGPASWSQWLSAWRVFQSAAIMLDIFWSTTGPSGRTKFGRRPTRGWLRAAGGHPRTPRRPSPPPRGQNPSIRGQAPSGPPRRSVRPRSANFKRRGKSLRLEGLRQRQGQAGQQEREAGRPQVQGPGRR